MSLELRLAATAAVAVAFVAVALTAGVYAAARSELRGGLDRALEERARSYVGGGPGDRGRGRPPGRHGQGPGPVRFGGAPATFQRVAPDGSVAAAAGETSSLPVDDKTRRIAATGQGRAFRDATVDGVHLRILSVGTGPAGAVEVARPLTEVDAALRRLLLVLAAMAAGGVAAASLLGALVARTALAPVRALTRRTEAVVDDPDGTHRLAVHGSDELARLARSFNASLDALQRSVEAQRQLVADASHELRTPLASLRANIQIYEEAHRLPAHERAGLRDDILAELDELTALVGDVAELARGAPAADVVDDVRLDQVTGALVERFRRRAGEAVTFRCALEETLVRGDPERVGRAVSNLLDNACKWSPPGGTVDVTLSGGWLEVRDEGPGFEPSDLAFVFDRFYRAAAARGRPGSGLGLAIVRQAAETFGGTALAANAPGGGGVVRVRFDAAPAPTRRLGTLDERLSLAP